MILNYIYGLIAFTVGVWSIEAIIIGFAVLLKNLSFIRLLAGMAEIITGIYSLILVLGAFFWLWSVTNFIIAVLLSFFFGGFIYGVAALPATIANLPFRLLHGWAEEKLGEQDS